MENNIDSSVDIKLKLDYCECQDDILISESEKFILPIKGKSVHSIKKVINFINNTIKYTVRCEICGKISKSEKRID